MMVSDTHKAKVGCLSIDRFGLIIISKEQLYAAQGRVTVIAGFFSGVMTARYMLRSTVAITGLVKPKG